MKVCPKCGAEYSNKVMFCGICGIPMSVSEGVDFKHKKNIKWKKPLCIIGGVFLIAVVVCFLFLASREEKTKEHQVAFIKGNGLYYAGNGDMEPVSLTNKLYDKNGSKKEDNEVLIGVRASDKVYLSEDNRIVFYPEDINEEGQTFTLRRCNLNSKAYDSEIIDKDVITYMVNEKGSIVTYLKGANATLYQMQGFERSKIATM